MRRMVALLLLSHDRRRRDVRRRTRARHRSVRGRRIIALLGLYDDLRGANATKKFLIQFAVAGLLFKLGFRFDVIANPFGEPIALGWASLPVTMLWVVGVINAMNLIDGLDGLAGGVALVAVITTFLVSLQRGHPLMMLFSSALAGAIVGFLFYNFNPASIFMGDTGSMFLGFVLAATAIQTNQKASTAVAVLIPGIALGLPIMDTLLAIGRRAVRGRPLFQADKEHIHHKLLDRGLSHRQAVLILYGFCICSAAPLSILTYASSGQSAALLVVLALLAFVFLRSLGYVRLDRMPESAATRRRNRALRAASSRSAAACASCGDRRRCGRWSSRPPRRWAPSRRPCAWTCRRCPRRPRLSTLSHAAPEAEAPTSAPFTFRFTVPSAKAAERTLELVWLDGRTEIDRDTEIAAEIFCEHLGEALDLARAARQPAALDAASAAAGLSVRSRGPANGT